jgi:hypothetical protein
MRIEDFPGGICDNRAHGRTFPDGSPQEDDYTIEYGTEILKVKYAESQTSTAKPGDFPGTGLHLHLTYNNPDLSQIPTAGVRVRTCLMAERRDKDGDLVIAIQSTPVPCFARSGSALLYEPSPNSGDFAYVKFDILSARVTEGRRN